MISQGLPYVRASCQMTRRKSTLPPAGHAQTRTGGSTGLLWRGAGAAGWGRSNPVLPAFMPPLPWPIPALRAAVGSPPPRPGWPVSRSSTTPLGGCPKLSRLMGPPQFYPLCFTIPVFLLPANAVILAVVAGAAPEAAVFPVKVNGINGPAGAVFKA